MYVHGILLQIINNFMDQFFMSIFIFTRVKYFYLGNKDDNKNYTSTFFQSNPLESFQWSGLNTYLNKRAFHLILKIYKKVCSFFSKKTINVIKNRIFQQDYN